MIESLPGERWLPVPGWEDLYLVSDQGRVYSKPRLVSCGHPGARPRRNPGRILKQGRGKDHPHPMVVLNSGSRSSTLRVHKLVLAAFVGPCPDGLQGLHWDDTPTNNHLSNLRYGTRSENKFDEVRNGRHPQANKDQCVNGHDFTSENTYIRPGTGHRACNTCMRDNTRQWRKRRREQTFKELRDARRQSA